MGLLAKIFGETKEIKFEGETTDGQTFTGQTKIEVIGMTPEEVLKSLARKIEFDKDVKVRWIKITDEL